MSHLQVVSNLRHCVLIIVYVGSIVPTDSAKIYIRYYHVIYRYREAMDACLSDSLFNDE